jgi:hypothetical protein
MGVITKQTEQPRDDLVRGFSGFGWKSPSQPTLMAHGGSTSIVTKGWSRLWSMEAGSGFRRLDAWP